MMQTSVCCTIFQWKLYQRGTFSVKKEPQKDKGVGPRLEPPYKSFVAHPPGTFYHINTVRLVSYGNI